MDLNFIAFLIPIVATQYVVVRLLQRIADLEYRLSAVEWRIADDDHK